MLLLISEIEKYKESIGKLVVELDNLMIKSNVLEVWDFSFMFILFIL